MAVLTGKQHAFVAAYIGDARGNATEAARIAGYAKPAEQGYENLRKPHIADAVAEWTEKAKVQAIATKQYRLDRLAEMERTWVTVFKAEPDTGVSKELREIYKHVAQETGDWEEKSAARVQASINLVLVKPAEVAGDA